jgi:uncharacterized protein (TIGR02145 family)
MKKMLFFVVILSFIFVSCNHKSEVQVVEIIPVSVLDLGTVSFKSDSTWVISGNGIIQEWSDVVMATGCNKSTYFGGQYDSVTETMNYFADCRTNPGHGDLFSWEAVSIYKNILCPDDWRVPTREDFRDLDIAMGGMGNNRFNVQDFIDANYISQSVWGGSYSYYSSWNGTLRGLESIATYWAQSVDEADNGYNLGFATSGTLHPHNRSSKCNGYMLRCVR